MFPVFPNPIYVIVVVAAILVIFYLRKKRKLGSSWTLPNNSPVKINGYAKDFGYLGSRRFIAADRARTPERVISSEA